MREKYWLALAALSAMGRRVDWIVEDAYGKIFSRRGLTLGERELMNVAALFLLDFDPQLYSHLRGALRVGVKVGALQQCIFALARMSGSSPREA